jgi:hypothetical protein
MRLIDAIFQIGDMDDNSVIFARQPFALSCEAVISELTDDFGIAETVKGEGYSYFLEKDLVVELLEMISGKVVTRDTKANFVCYYATNDAYPLWFYDLPSE